MAVSVLFDRDFHSSQTGLTSSDLVLTTISNTELTAGHRYLVMGNGLGAGGMRAEWEMKFGGTKDGAMNAEMSGYSGGTGLKSYKAMTLWTAVSGQDIEMTCREASGGGVVRNANLMAIDLDSAGLVEDTDWFYAENTTNELDFHHSYGSENEPATLTFTPDGTSDYLVIGGARFYNGGGNRHMIMRVRDTTNSVTVSQAGIGSGNIGTEHHCYAGFGVLSAPPATPITLKTEYRSFSPWDKDDAKIIVIRLNVFQNYAFFDNDINANSGTVDVKTSVGTVDITPGSSQELVLFGAVQSESSTSFSSSDNGIAGSIEVDSSEIYNTSSAFSNFPSQVTHHDGSDNYNGDLGARVGPWIFEKLTGQSEVEKTVEMFYWTSTSGSNSKPRQMMLLAFGTDEVISAPSSKASSPSPSDAATDQVPAIDLGWTSGVGGGTISHDVYFGTDSSAVTSATTSSPEFKGNQALAETTFDPGEFAGDDLVNGTYYWRIDTKNEGGTLAGDVWSFTVFPSPSKTTGHNPSNTAIDIDPAIDLSWSVSSGTGSVQYDAYFSAVEAEVTRVDNVNITPTSTQSGTTLDVGTLTVNTTYYWRVDAFSESGNTAGDTLSFTTLSPRAKATVPDPTDTNTSVLPNKILGWTDGTGAGTLTHDVYFGTDQTAVTNGTGGTSKGNQASNSYDPGLMAEFTTYYWRIDEVNEAGTTTGDVWSLTTVAAVDVPPPSKATSPSPSDTTTGLGIVAQSLAWTTGTGIGSVSHNVYLGTSSGLTDAADSRGNQSSTTYNIPEQLRGGTTYYWRVDEADTFGGVTTGDTWSFTTLSFAPKLVNAINRPFPVMVEVHFDTEMLQDAGLIDPDNYIFDHGAFATSVDIIDDKQVKLTVENLFDFSTFTVTVTSDVKGFSEEGVNSSFNSKTFSLASVPQIDDEVKSISVANGRMKSGNQVVMAREDAERWYIMTESGLDVVNKISLRNEGFILDGYGFNTILVG